MWNENSTRKQLSTSIILRFEPSFEDRQWTDYFDVELSYSTLENIQNIKIAPVPEMQVWHVSALNPLQRHIKSTPMPMHQSI